MAASVVAVRGGTDKGPTSAPSVRDWPPKWPSPNYPTVPNLRHCCRACQLAPLVSISCQDRDRARRKTFAHPHDLHRHVSRGSVSRSTSRGSLNSPTSSIGSDASPIHDEQR